MSSQIASKNTRQPRIVIIGAGVAGIAAAIRLTEEGYDDIAVYEKADDIGGTWRDNTYPGIACDVPSHLYNYSFALNPNWSHFFSPGAEIHQYLKDVADKFNVGRLIKCGHEVEECRFENGRWSVGMTNGLTDRADILIPATGVLHHPQFPDIAGISDFEGPCFHTAQWDHSIDLSDKRVAIIGTGSTSAQVVSSIVDTAYELTVFQRTAQWIFPQENKIVPEEEQQKLRDDPEGHLARYHKMSDLGIEVFSDAVIDADAPRLKELTKICSEFLENSISDPELREKLRPDYRVGCKRLVMSNDFYKAVQKPNANVVTEKIDSIEANGIRTADGNLHEIDVLILATGFKVDAFTRPMKVVGRGGVDLDHVWNKRPSAYLSISVPEFPNFFMLNGPNGPVGNINLIQVAEFELEYILQLTDLVRTGQANQISASPAALDRFDQARIDKSKDTIWATGCNSWYLDDRGIPLVWPWSYGRFKEEMKQPKLEDYDLFKDSERVSASALEGASTRTFVRA